MYCIKCGKNIPDESIYCMFCGILLNNKTDLIIINNEKKTLIVVEGKKSGWGKYKIKIFVDNNNIKEIKSNNSTSFEIINGRHIIYCETSFSVSSIPIEIVAKSNEIHFSVTLNLNYELIMIKTKETDEGTWE